MTEQLTINVILNTLRNNARAWQEAARRAQLERERRQRVEAEGKRQRQPIDAAVPWPGAVPETSVASAELAAYRRGFPFAIGWIVKQSVNITQVVSGDGAVGLPFETATQGIYDAEESPCAFSNSLTCASTTNFGWNTWSHRVNPSELTAPAPDGVWRRFRPVQSFQLGIRPSGSASYNRDVSIPLPLGQAMIYVRASSLDWYQNDYKIGASTTIDYTTELPYVGMMYTVEEVAGSVAEDPDALLGIAARDKAMALIINSPNVVSVLDSVETNVSHDVFKCYNIGRTSVREVPAPASVQTFVDELYGTIPDPEDQSYGALPDLMFSALPRPHTLVIDGITWTEYRTSGLGTFTGYTRKNPNLSMGANPELGYLWGGTPAVCFGIGTISADYASMGYGGDDLGTPFVYRIIDGSQSYTYDDFYGTMLSLSGCIAGMAPMPKGLVWIDRNFDGSSDHEAYQAPERSLTFELFPNSAANARGDGTWYNFAGDGKPVQSGSLTASLVPLASRVAPGVGFESATSLIFTTPYGDGTYCRNNLLALGFSSADLVP
jgi:hypothetical protein